MTALCRACAGALACVWVICAARAPASAKVSGPSSVGLSVEAVGYGTATEIRSTPTNPDNLAAGLPLLTAGLQLRADLRASSLEDRLLLVMRPRFWGSVDYTCRANLCQRGDSANWSMDALYLQVRASSWLSLSFGRQQFEWGPAAFINTSNRVFHVNALQRTGIFTVRGKDLLRINLAHGQGVSMVALAELRGNGDPFFGEERFDRKGLLKVEYASESGARYGGVVVGAGELTRPWLGIYGSLEVRDGLSLHFDQAVTLGSRSLHPIDTGGSIVFQRTLVDSRRPEVLGIAGGRYTTLTGLQFGLEWVINTAGYDRRQLADAFLSVTTASANLAANYRALSNPGLEVLGRNQLYLSLLAPDLNARWQIHLSLGYLQSLTDGSGRLLGYLDAALGSSVVVFLNVLGAHGELDAEHAALIRGAVLIGARYTW